MRCQDKILRKRLTDYIISSLSKVNEKHKNVLEDHQGGLALFHPFSLYYKGDLTQNVGC